MDLSDMIMGFDPTFELDDFYKPRLREEDETVKNIVLYLLFTRPGQYPSLPHIGLDIRNRLYSYYEELNESELQRLLSEQCMALIPHFNRGAIGVRKMKSNGKPVLLIHINTTEAADTQIREHSSWNRDFFIGITFNELDQLIYNVNVSGNMVGREDIDRRSGRR